ncbi:DUF2852 domain-containing protein [Paracoccus yeei]|jgi:hypothetical protein|uniref:DUF2852 domain-containing protein n=1 Tax=Paracoccus yeei TaxID=147645 RepID=UPI003BF91FEF
MNTNIVPQPSVMDRIGLALAGVRDWLDDRGKPAWIFAMILGFVFCWPVGLAILGYMIWSKRMFSCRHTRHDRYGGARRMGRHPGAPTGNAAFDAYRDETLKRLEDEHREFLDFLQKLREARDKAEFDQFMAGRGEPREPQA